MQKSSGMEQPISVYRSFPLGTLMISGTHDSILEIRFCHDMVPIPEEKAVSKPLSPVFDQCIGELHEYFDGARREFSFPVGQPGTEFQQKVWKELGKIPFGSTISYLELSKRLGDVKAIRAAASANGKNKLAIVIPCHRVIGANQDLVGYAGGLGMKRWLLDHEAKIACGVQTLF